MPTVDERIERFVRLCAEGRTHQEIGAAEDPPVSANAVCQALRRAGVFTKRKPRGRARATALWELHESSGLSWETIGAMQDPPIQGQSVRALLAFHGLYAPQPIAKVQAAARERAAALWASYHAGASAEALGAAQQPPLSATALLALLRRYGYAPETLHRRRGPRPPTDKASERVQRFLARTCEGWTLTDIGAAEDPPISVSAVSRALRRAGVTLECHPKQARPGGPGHRRPGRPRGRVDKALAAARAAALWASYQAGTTAETLGAAQQPPVTASAVLSLLRRYGYAPGALSRRRSLVHGTHAARSGDAKP